MIKTYEEFVRKLNDRIKSDDSFYYELLVTVIKNPNRYTGIFRLSNVKTKLIQNVTQSREIKFGDFMEDIITEYIEKMGYCNLDKNIGVDEDGNGLSADQVFKRGDTVYLIEQKIRDDHDSTKKRGQYQNFQKKYKCLQRKHPDCVIDATMWFIDNSLVKNRSFYRECAALENEYGINIHILYGGDLFVDNFQRTDVWEEICEYLRRNKAERSDEVLTIPDFDTSAEMLRAIQKLKIQEPSLARKLVSMRPEYVQLRNELFPTGRNLRVLGYRG